MKQISTKVVVIDSCEYPVRVFESCESAASRKGRTAVWDNTLSFEQRHEQMAEAAWVNGVHPLSESYERE